MMKKHARFCMLLIVWLPKILCAQVACPESWRFEVRTANVLTLRVDSLSIVPGTFCIYEVPDSAFRLDCVSATLYLADSSLLNRPLLLSYAVFALDYSAPLSHRVVETASRSRSRPVNPASSLSTVADMEDENKLVSTGSISRGVSVGTSSDFVLNSSLNLQMAGSLSDDISVLASVTDKNIPIQPEGTTQSINDISSVFIHLFFKDVATLRAGDLEMTAPESAFLCASRNLLGLDLTAKTNPAPALAMSNVVGGGIAKGKFVRQSIAVQNGVQGPYKLYGKENEVNIVVVAGSERVYVDGVLLTRGQDNDYVMDYNTAEITFTPSMLVTAEKRIIVEMEYTDRHYTRYNLYAYNELQLGKQRKWKLNVNYFQEQDLKNQSVQPELTDNQKLFLSSIGDNEAAALYAGADTAQFSTDRILYEKRDTIVEGVLYDVVYQYSINQNAVLYALSFTYLGPGKGNYALLRSTSNGRVFGWVAPKEGIPQGDYEPVVQLATPKLQQLATIAAEYGSGKGTVVKTELAVSNDDQNTFSKMDDSDNVGFAYLVQANHSQWLGRDTSALHRWRLKSELGWQFIHKNFSAVESFREVEFARNYNLEEDYSQAHSEQMLNAQITFEKLERQAVSYKLNWFTRLGDVSALRQQLDVKGGFRGLGFSTKTSFLTTRDSVQTSQYWVSDNKLSCALGKLEVGATDLVEHNVFKDRWMDTLRASSNAFNEFVAYVKSRESSWCDYQLSYKNRVEFLPVYDDLRKSMSIHEANGKFQIENIKNQHITVQSTYRNQAVCETGERQPSEHYFVGNAEYSGRWLKNALILNTYYEAGTGMELEKTYTFLKVAAGQGTHIWVDYDGDGIEDLGEFEVAAFQDEADYVKVWLSGTQYHNTYNSQFSQGVQLRPAAVWARASGFKRFVSRFSDVAMLRSQVKRQQPCFNPFYAQLEDSNLVDRSMNFTNTFSFNNSLSPFAFDFIVQATQNKSLLYYGYEYGQTNAQQIVLKSAPCSVLFLSLEGRRALNENYSQCLSNRDYRLLSYAIKGSVHLQFYNKYIVEISYEYEDKGNTLAQEEVRRQSAEVEASLKMARKGVLTGSARYVGIAGDAGQASAVSYQLLQGLAIGHNVVWGVSYQMALTDFLQIALQYDGRYSNGHSAVHTGSLSVKAQF